WLGLMFYLVTILFVLDVVRFGARLAARVVARMRPPPSAAMPDAPDVPSAEALESRRLFVARAVATSALVASGGIGAFGIHSALWDITLPEIPIRLARLPKALDGYTIALWTDVHIGPLLDARFLRHLAELTNRAKPDLIAIGGDLVDARVEQIGAQVAELRRLRARDGVCFVTGNHEYYSGARQWCEFLDKLGVRVLMNERIALGDAAISGAQFDLAGIPDHRAGVRSTVAPNAREATRGRDPERELVMLAHQPVQIADTAPVGAGLQLSGHTHGGQLYPFGAVALLSQPYLAGLHLHEPSGTQVYVSRGTGFWGPPMRVLAPAEISLIRLYSA
ncbi:MAG TPA: metallophosphoesterase, partial [Polyangiales bacterium]|nr:metallophosphoesterase [Polyangiales bacterium]